MTGISNRKKEARKRCRLACEERQKNAQRASDVETKKTQNNPRRLPRKAPGNNCPSLEGGIYLRTRSQIRQAALQHNYLPGPMMIAQMEEAVSAPPAPIPTPAPVPVPVPIPIQVPVLVPVHAPNPSLPAEMPPMNDDGAECRLTKWKQAEAMFLQDIIDHLEWNAYARGRPSSSMLKVEGDYRPLQTEDAPGIKVEECDFLVKIEDI
ncbi:hypothetical protein DFH29DRAFT_1005386 [Suillus ampliporus]|nr:hypothetical protein DFH29DRAFT_1005386 [Suillus ampliporus]